jgi:ketosteroid isomerase-like protein
VEIEMQDARFCPAGEADAVAALGTRDAILMPPGALPMAGSSAVEESFEAMPVPTK